MDSLPTTTNDSSRPEIDHSKSEDNLLLKLNFESYSEPMHYDYRTANKLQQNNENLSTQPQISNDTNQTNKDRLEINFTDFVNSHRQFSFDNLEMDATHKSSASIRSRKSTEGFAPIDENSDDELSTPIVSDLDELLADTPNMQRISDTCIDQLHINTHAPSFPVHGISIPYNYNVNSDEESDTCTPEPCDTPLTQNGDIIPCAYFEEMKLSSDESDIDYDQFVPAEMDIPCGHPALSPKSKSMQAITMTRMNYKKCKKIKCITPITQAMAEWNLNNMQTRRRSVANITPSVHKLFKLDDDLLRIREQYLKRTQSEESDENENQNENQNESVQNKTNDKANCNNTNRRSIPLKNIQIRK